MTPEARVNEEIAQALMTFRFCVLPKPHELWRLPVSPWSMADPLFHIGIAWRQNTGLAKYGRRAVRFGIPGNPDWAGWDFKTGRTLAIEAKSAKGTLSPDQRAYAALAARTGVLVGLARSYDECAMLLETWGFERP